MNSVEKLPAKGSGEFLDFAKPDVSVCSRPSSTFAPFREDPSPSSRTRSIYRVAMLKKLNKLAKKIDNAAASPQAKVVYGQCSYLLFFLNIV